MHPGMFARWKARHHGEYAPQPGCGPEGGHGWGHHGHHYDFGGGGEGDELGAGAFGVRRPLRFLAHKLELEDKQVGELARILNDLKTERAQAAVDNRRTVAAFADSMAGETFDEAAVGEAAKERVASAERLRAAVVRALGQIHALLDGEQRERFAYLVRTGALIL